MAGSVAEWGVREGEVGTVQAEEMLINALGKVAQDGALAVVDEGGVWLGTLCPSSLGVLLRERKFTPSVMELSVAEFLCSPQQGSSKRPRASVKFSDPCEQSSHLHALHACTAC